MILKIKINAKVDIAKISLKIYFLSYKVNLIFVLDKMKELYFTFYLFIEYNIKLNNLKNVFKGYFCNFYLFFNL